LTVRRARFEQHRLPRDAARKLLRRLTRSDTDAQDAVQNSFRR
jgi:DNA-directed RNA polymerase specialized sigma24 family protein